MFKIILVLFLSIIPSYYGCLPLEQPQFKKATQEDWNTLPMPEANVFIPVSIIYPKEHFEIIQMGLIPEAMENKWFIYSENDHLYFHRSWTGFMIYDCLFVETEHEVEIIGFYANRDPNQYTNTSDEIDINTLKLILHCMLLKHFTSELLA